MSEEHTCRTCQHLLQNNICGSDEHKTMQLDDVCGAWEESILARLITEHPERIPLKFQNAELLQKVQQLEVRNAELEDLRRWRDARKELPPDGIFLAEVEYKTIDGDYIEIIAVEYDKAEDCVWGMLVQCSFDWEDVIAWRPLDLSEEVE